MAKKIAEVGEKAAVKVDEIKTVVQTTAKAVEAKAEELKESKEVKKEEAKAETKAEAPVTVEEEAPVAEKPEKKRPGRRPGSKNKTTKAEKVVKKEGADPEIFIQFGPGEASVQAAVDKIRAQYVEQGHRASAIKSLKVYLKPEDQAAYYVINDKAVGKVDLF
jgi:hypothetical protein